MRRPLLAFVFALVTPVALFARADSSATKVPIPKGLLGGSPTSMKPVANLPSGVAVTPTGAIYKPPPGAAEWTVMVYTAADNDLEKALLDDIDEMECVGSSPQVHVVAEIDRWRPAQGSDEDDRDDARDGDWDDARRYEITKDDCTTKIGSTRVADLGEIDTSHPAELAKFIAWAAKKYPAKHYALVMGDHGSGWKGGYVDENAPGESGSMEMTIAELRDALEEGRKQAAIPKLDLLATDACMMATLEVADAIAPHVQVWAASQELVPGPGFDYTPILKALTANPSMDAYALGKAFVASMRTYYGPLSAETDPTVTEAAFDLSKIDAVRASVEALANALAPNAKASSARALGAAAQVVDQFGPQIDPLGGTEDGFADLVQVAAVVRESSADAAAKKAAADVIAAVDAARIDSFEGASHAHARGLSIWLPPAEDVDDWLADYREVPFGKSSPWTALLATYAHAFDGDVAPTIKNVLVTRDASNPLLGPRTVAATIDGDVRDAEMIVSMTFLSTVVPIEVDAVTDPSLYVALPEGPGVVKWKKGSNVVSAKWTPTYVTLSGKSGELPLQVNREKLGAGTFDATANLKDLSTGDEDPIVLRFATTAGGGAKLVSGFYVDQEGGRTYFTPFDPKTLDAKASAITPRYEIVEKGAMKSITLPLEVRWSAVDDLKTNVRPALPGVYAITIVAQDYAGQVATAKTTTTLP